jgi:hypothetical protein
MRSQRPSQQLRISPTKSKLPNAGNAVAKAALRLYCTSLSPEGFIPESGEIRIIG